MTAKRSAPRFLLFLDFDGVLHPVNAGEHERFRPDAIREVNRIISALDASVVLSTSWRMDCDFGKFNAWIKGRIIGSTPVHQIDMRCENPRFHEVVDFLKCREWLHIPWLSIDDKKSHFPGDAPAYITNPDIGITEHDADNIIFAGLCMKHAQRSILGHLSRRGYRD